MTEKLGLVTALFTYLRDNGLLDESNGSRDTIAVSEGPHIGNGAVQDLASVGPRNDALLNQLVEQGDQDCCAGVSKL
jgi:hypothetical protein